MSKLVNSLDNFTTPAIEEIIHLLVERNARDHINKIAKLMDHSEKRIRLAAIRAVGELGDGSYLDNLTEIYLTSDNQSPG